MRALSNARNRKIYGETHYLAVTEKNYTRFVLYYSFDTGDNPASVSKFHTLWKASMGIRPNEEQAKGLTKARLFSDCWKRLPYM